jgi:hypothetical protein
VCVYECEGGTRLIYLFIHSFTDQCAAYIFFSHLVTLGLLCWRRCDGRPVGFREMVGLFCGCGVRMVLCCCWWWWAVVLCLLVDGKGRDDDGNNAGRLSGGLHFCCWAAGCGGSF